VSGSGADQLIRYDAAAGNTARRKRRVLYAVFNTVVVVVVLAAVVEAATGSPIYGIDTTSVSGSNNGVELKVRYARATRGQLVTPLEITITRADGFAEPIVLAVTAGYLGFFITQGPSPEAESETATATDLIMTFDQPPGDTFAVDWNLTPPPVGSFTTVPADVAVFDAAGRPIVSVHLETKVRV
jgi:hypothetical protein